VDASAKDILRESPGAFIMPIGPIFSGEAESVHFQIETIGKRFCARFRDFFFKYRAGENFAFQDFPIIMATFGLSVAENDR